MRSLYNYTIYIINKLYNLYIAIYILLYIIFIHSSKILYFKLKIKTHGFE